MRDVGEVGRLLGETGFFPGEIGLLLGEFGLLLGGFLLLRQLLLLLLQFRFLGGELLLLEGKLCRSALDLARVFEIVLAKGDCLRVELAFRVSVALHLNAKTRNEGGDVDVLLASLEKALFHLYARLVAQHRDCWAAGVLLDRHVGPASRRNDALDRGLLTRGNGLRQGERESGKKNS